MGKRQSKKERKDRPSSQRNAKESEAFLQVHERRNQDTTMNNDGERRTSRSRNPLRWCFGKFRRSTSQYDIEHAESSLDHLKITPSKKNDRAERYGQRITNIDHEKFTSLKREQQSTEIHLNDIEITTEPIATETELAKKTFELNNERIARQQLEAQLNDRNNVIEQRENEIKTLTDDKEKYRKQNEHDTKTINEMNIKIKTLEEEKQDTLRRMRSIKSKFLSECVESMSPDKKEHSLVHLQSDASSENVLNENEGPKLTNIDNEVLTSLRTELDRFQELFQNLETLLDGQNTVIKQHENTIQELERFNATLNKSLTDQKEKMDKELEHQKQQCTNMLTESERQIQKLNGDNKILNEEKQEALRRLSAMMSTKLRDNNPNIADLSDQFRPTKLGEQFSELYDNEWTDAFDVLQNKFEERHAISVLLDIAMDTYWFCEQELREEWKFTEKWFIQKDAPSAQQIKKTLKDARKQTLVGRVSEIEEKYIDYLLTLCSNDNLIVLVKSSKVRCYIASCVRLTLLMTANDPPVVIECPGWQPFSERPYEERKPDVSIREQESTTGLCESTATENKDDSDSLMNNNSFQAEAEPNTPDGILLGEKHEGEIVESGESNINSGDMTIVTNTFAQKRNSVEMPTELPSAEMTIGEKSNDTVNKLTDSSENQVDSKNNRLENMESMKMLNDQQNEHNNSLRWEDDENIPSSLLEEIPSGSETPTAHDNANEISTVAVEHVQSDNGITVDSTLQVGGTNIESDQDKNTYYGFGTTPNPIEFVNQPSGIKNQRIVHERPKESKTNENAEKMPMTKERADFDKDKFKEYTSRGPFVDYVVWPIMYLHRDGPMLGKGIAQGCKEKMEDGSCEPFVWWKRLPTTHM
ncbi:uncharacterized protein LOC127851702 [Dreissena polymorpha]|uniref:Mitochondria-eating protein C-terminal domain-containing protein n=1 Tax=Dreissena polymorpha TaxID=45954 RepID=A0A9D4D268_DREPO|nr:uncharacterized protein LOC127851702 [Dreissena polymorpha]KAH3737728.1 hypothetical protein DPMN_044321 [Dreissena polymorpha]